MKDQTPLKSSCDSFAIELFLGGPYRAWKSSSFRDYFELELLKVTHLLNQDILGAHIGLGNQALLGAILNSSYYRGSTAALKSSCEDLNAALQMI